MLIGAHHWKCPKCKKPQTTEVDDILGPFVILKCRCGAEFYISDMNTKYAEVKRKKKK